MPSIGYGAQQHQHRHPQAQQQHQHDAHQSQQQQHPSQPHPTSQSNQQSHPHAHHQAYSQPHAHTHTDHMQSMHPNSGMDMFQSETGLEDEDDEEGMYLSRILLCWLNLDFRITDTRAKRPRPNTSQPFHASRAPSHPHSNSNSHSHDPDAENDNDNDNDVSDKDEPQRRKIKIEYIPDKSRRHITFSKRKAGIMKKAYELSILTGTQVLLLVVSETGLVYTFTTNKLQPLVQKSEGKNLIQVRSFIFFPLCRNTFY